MAHFTKSDINDLDRLIRLSLVNSITGYKPANLIGTVNGDGLTNLAIISSVVHMGSDPATLGFFMRPMVTERHTMENIQETGFYTINHVHETIAEKAHFTSADFSREESEFDMCQLQAEFKDGFAAPYVDEAHGDLMPEQKIEHIRRLMAEHHYVGMIGDGVNDAPAVALASVGIAMGAIGSDTAIETADMALMKDDLTRVAEAISLGRRTLRIIQFNVTFALVVKAIFLILAFIGHTSLWLAILADTGATLLVIMNALRLLSGATNLNPRDL